MQHGVSSMAWRTGYVGDALTELKPMATNTRWSDRQVFVQMCGMRRCR